MSKKLTTIIYHHVLSKPNLLYKFDPDISEFEQQIKWLSKIFTCLTVSNAINLLKENKLPLNTLCITFDDGYSDFYSNALPILQKYNVPATMYVTTNCLDNIPLWNEKLHSIILNPDIDKINCTFFDLGEHSFDLYTERVNTILFLEQQIKHLNASDRINFIDKLGEKYPCYINRKVMLNKKQLIELNNLGIEIGSHTLSHPILSCCSYKQAKQEIFNSKIILESIINKPILSFAYPNGKLSIDYQQEHVTLVKEAGYTSALASDSKPIGSFSEFQIPRFSPARHQGIGLLLRIFKNKFFK